MGTKSKFVDLGQSMTYSKKKGVFFPTLCLYGYKLLY